MSENDQPIPEQDTVDEAATAEVDLLQVEDIDQFARLITGWHRRKIAMLEHMLSVPAGTEVSLNNGQMAPLQGDLHTGYLIGLTLALTEMGALPFAAELDDAPAPVKH